VLLNWIDSTRHRLAWRSGLLGLGLQSEGRLRWVLQRNVLLLRISMARSWGFSASGHDDSAVSLPEILARKFDEDAPVGAEAERSWRAGAGGDTGRGVRGGARSLGDNRPAPAAPSMPRPRMREG